MKKIIPLFLVYACVLAVGFMAACSTNSNGRNERTFPEAFNFSKTNIEQLRDHIVTPDSVNVNAYVIGIRACPPPKSTACIAPDGIYLSESPAANIEDTTFFLSAFQPKQFEKGKRYKISVSKEINSNKTRTFFRLIGYSPCKPTQK